MKILDWLAGIFSRRGKALSLYRRGMERAHHHDNAGAIEDYTAIIEMPKAPPDVRAMALFNRALMHSSDENYPRAIHDLNAVLAMNAAPDDVRTEARRKLERMKRQCPDKP